MFGNAAADEMVKDTAPKADKALTRGLLIMTEAIDAVSKGRAFTPLNNGKTAFRVRQDKLNACPFK